MKRAHHRDILSSIRPLCRSLKNQNPALWPWPASQEQMVARPEVKFDLNAEIQNSKSTRIALLKMHPSHLLSPARTTEGVHDWSLLTNWDLCAKYRHI